MTRYIRIDYALEPNVDLEDTKAAIAQFVDGIMNHHPDHRYMSFQHSADDRRFTHFGELVSDVVADLQTKPFFRELGSICGNVVPLGLRQHRSSPSRPPLSNPVIFKASNKDVNPESEEKNHAA